jgi:Polyketide cyclase / dehydrase and lipid transport
MTMGRYRFVSEWQVAASSERVWNALLDYQAWPTWWQGFRTVERLAPGDEHGVGLTLRQGWRSRLPYTLVFDLEILRIERLRLLAGRATGDVEGTCSWTLVERDGATRVRFILDVRTTRWWMRVPVPFASRIFASNFETIMRRGSEGIARLLSTDVVDRTAVARLAPA